MAGWLELEGSRLERLLEVLGNCDITYFRLREGDVEVVISRDVQPRDPGDLAQPGTSARPGPARPGPVQPAVAVGPAQPLSQTAQDTGTPDPAAGTPSLVLVSAPMSGFFHRTPEPGAAPFVAVGTAVTEESTVGLVEAMKVFTAVQAGVTGVVTEVLVEAGAFIEEGQPVVSVRPSGAAGEGLR